MIFGVSVCINTVVALLANLAFHGSLYNGLC